MNVKTEGDMTGESEGDRAALAPPRPKEEQLGIAELLPQIEQSARGIAARTRIVAADELKAIGESALVDAGCTYDPTRGVPFHAYAALVARGAMKNAVKRERRRRKRELTEDATGAPLFDACLTSCVRG